QYGADLFGRGLGDQRRKAVRALADEMQLVRVDFLELGDGDGSLRNRGPLVAHRQLLSAARASADGTRRRAEPCGDAPPMRPLLIICQAASVFARTAVSQSPATMTCSVPFSAFTTQSGPR